MAGAKVSSYSIGDVNLTALMNTEDKQRLGFHAVSLTEYDTDTVPAIAAGSCVEIDGALYYFESDEAITVGSVADGTVYIVLIPDGDNVTAEFTGTAPTWNDAKYGYYEVDSNENHRFLNFVMTKSGSDYSNKRFIPHEPETKIDEVTINSLDITSFLTSDISQPGYVKIGPLYMQWGYDANPTDGEVVTFPIEFPTACLSVVTSGSGAGVFDESGDTPVYIVSVSTVSFAWANNQGAGSGQACYWFAIGY